MADAGDGTAGGGDGGAPAAGQIDPAMQQVLQTFQTSLQQMNNNFMAAVTALQAAQPAPVYALDANTPFNLHNRASKALLDTMSSSLTFSGMEKWDGSMEKLPIFQTALRLRAAGQFWNQGTGDILTINGHHLFDNITQITMQDVQNAHNNRADHRARQNAKAMYDCIVESIDGPIYSTLFNQDGNNPPQDGPTLYYIMMQHTGQQSVQVKINAREKLANLNPGAHKFELPALNTELSRLFVLSQHVDEMEKILAVLKVYKKIRQPVEWVQWVDQASSRILDPNGPRAITQAQAFMNEAAGKATELTQTLKWKEASTISKEDAMQKTLETQIIAMITNQKKQSSGVTASPTAATGGAVTDTPKTKSTPPFLKHWNTDGTRHKVGDTKQYNGQTYHFCDYPDHRAGIKWHTHTAEDCKLRKKWIDAGKPKANNSATPPSAVAHVATNVVTNAATDNTSDTNANAGSTGTADHAVFLANLLLDPQLSDEARASISEHLQTHE